MIGQKQELLKSNTRLLLLLSFIYFFLFIYLLIHFSSLKEIFNLNVSERVCVWVLKKERVSDVITWNCKRALAAFNRGNRWGRDRILFIPVNVKNKTTPPQIPPPQKKKFSIFLSACHLRLTFEFSLMKKTHYFTSSIQQDTFWMVWRAIIV